MKKTSRKTEVKWIEQNSLANNIVGQASFLVELTPGNLAQGTQNGQRIGDRIKSRFIRMKLRVENVMNAGTANHTTQFRCIVLAPRVDAATFITYISNVANFNPQVGYVDTNMATVLWDRNYNLSNLAAVGTNYSSGDKAAMWFDKVFRHARNVNYGRGGVAMGDGRDRLYLYIVNLNTVGDSSITASLFTRMTYVDL